MQLGSRRGRGTLWLPRQRPTAAATLQLAGATVGRLAMSHVSRTATSAATLGMGAMAMRPWTAAQACVARSQHRSRSCRRGICCPATLLWWVLLLVCLSACLLLRAHCLRLNPHHEFLRLFKARLARCSADNGWECTVGRCARATRRVWLPGRRGGVAHRRAVLPELGCAVPHGAHAAAGTAAARPGIPVLCCTDCLGFRSSAMAWAASATAPPVSLHNLSDRAAGSATARRPPPHKPHTHTHTHKVPCPRPPPPPGVCLQRGELVPPSVGGGRPAGADGAHAGG
jgi:hypothetical protein